MSKGAGGGTGSAWANLGRARADVGRGRGKAPAEPGRKGEREDLTLFFLIKAKKGYCDIKNVYNGLKIQVKIG